jgi:hypothetical protein
MITLSKITVRTLFLIVFISFIACKNEPKVNAIPVEKDAPTEGVVAQAFYKRFANVENVYFDTLNTGIEISFSQGDSDRTALFDRSGNLIYVSTYVENDSLPPIAQQYLNSKYKNATLNIIHSVEEGNENYFVAEIETASYFIAIQFDKNGKFVKETKTPLSKDEMEQREEEGVEDDDNKK